MIEREVQKQVGIEKKAGRKTKYKTKTYLAAVLAAVMLLGTTVFAGVIYQMRRETVGTYGVRIKGIESESSSSFTGQTQENSKVKMDVSYLPDGMIEAEDGKYCYENAMYQGGVSILFYHMDTEDAQFDMLVKNVKSSETVKIGLYDGIYLELQGGSEDEISFNQRIYVAYSDFQYVMEMYIASNVSKEEALQIAKGIRLLTAEEGAEGNLVQAYGWSEYLLSNLASEEEIEVLKDDIWKPSSVLKNTHTIGESFLADSLKEGEEDWLGLGQVEIKVTEVQIAEDIQLLDLSKVDEDFRKDVQKETDETGKLLPVKINYIKYGDGIQTLDTIVDSREVPQRLVYVTLEYTNIGEKELPEMLFMGELMKIVEKNNQVKAYRGEDAGNDLTWDEAVIGGAARYLSLIHI